jgi:hypothetical protein
MSQDEKEEVSEKSGVEEVNGTERKRQNRRENRLQSNLQQSWKRSAGMAMKVIKAINLKMILNCSLKNVSIYRHVNLKRSHV